MAKPNMFKPILKPGNTFVRRVQNRRQILDKFHLRETRWETLRHQQTQQSTQARARPMKDGFDNYPKAKSKRGTKGGRTGTAPRGHPDPNTTPRNLELVTCDSLSV